MTTHGARRSMAVAIAATVSGVLPVFLTGALAVQMRPALHESTSTLGVAVGAFFVAAAVGSAPMGRLADRVGPRSLLVGASLLSAAAQLAIAVWVGNPIELVVALLVAGPANAAGQVAANLLLSRNVNVRRQGVAFGVKQAAIPLATLLGGLSVPAVALTVGWRWAYVAGSAFAFVAAGLAAEFVATAKATEAKGAGIRRGRDEARARRLPMPALAVLAFGAGLGSASANALGAFLVSSAVVSGISPGGAGLLAALGSAFGLVARLVSGILADRRGKAHLLVVAGMLALGSIGEGLLSRDLPLPFLLGAVAVAYGAGWGWNGLLNLAVVRQVPLAPAAATGVTQTGVNAGGALGPIVFGFVLTATSYSRAWAMVSALALAAALLVVVSRRLLRAE